MNTSMHAEDDDNWTTSYALGTDIKTGWGDRYFFTYFTQLDDNNKIATIIEMSLLIITFLVSMASNMMILACLVKFPDMRTSANCYVLNLAVAAIIFSLTIPAVTYSRLTSAWELGDVTCKLVPYTQFATGSILQWIPALISIDRRCCVIVPPFRSNLTPTKTVFQSIILWVSLFAASSPIMLWFRTQTISAGSTICTFVVPKAMIHISVYVLLPLFLILLLIPACILSYNCGIICKRIVATKGVWAKSCVENVEICDPRTRHKTRRQSELSLSDIFTPFPRRHSLSHQEELRVNRHVRVVRILVLNVIVVVAMYVCYIAGIVLIFVDSSREDTNFFLRSHLFIGLLIVTYVLSVANPIIYGLLSDNYRVCIEKMCCISREEEIIIRQELNGNGRNQSFSGKSRSRKLSTANSIPEGPGVT